MFFFYVFPVSGMINLIVNLKKMILVLLSVEYIILILYLILSLKLSHTINILMSLYYLVFSLCEGVLGLSLLIFVSRAYGSDYVFGFSYI